jgi:hypothetical protein
MATSNEQVKNWPIFGRRQEISLNQSNPPLALSIEFVMTKKIGKMYVIAAALCNIQRHR